MDDDLQQEGAAHPEQAPAVEGACPPPAEAVEAPGPASDGISPPGPASYWLMVSRPLGAVSLHQFEDLKGLQAFVGSASRELVEDGCRVVVFHGHRLDIRRRPAAFDLVGDGGKGVVLYQEPETDLNPDPPEGA